MARVLRCAALLAVTSTTILTTAPSQRNDALLSWDGRPSTTHAPVVEGPTQPQPAGAPPEGTTPPSVSPVALLEVRAPENEPLPPPGTAGSAPAPAPPTLFSLLAELTGEWTLPTWRCIDHRESKGNWRAVGAAGELGRLQIHPYWWNVGFARLGQAWIAQLDPFSVEAQAYGAAAIWRSLGGRWSKIVNGVEQGWTTAIGCVAR